MVKWILTVSISLLDGHMAIVYYIIDKKNDIDSILYSEIFSQN